ncbi:hypothetical protein JK358_24515 [Nocardia sp. 2]|uniref:Clp R domain-containing protein n=1 Tax=Nocardia acididurans TaxID=2802282 RepID=A0ABS1MCW8_9NOCA|nr:hypothetical protein [Nocardia acididurans]MBL1077574.1 hypothetical protein [Nocardia acididurans]
MIEPRPLAPELVRLLNSANRIAEHGGTTETGIEHLLLAMLLNADELPVDELRKHNLELGQVFTRIAEHAARR